MLYAVLQLRHLHAHALHLLVQQFHWLREFTPVHLHKTPLQYVQPAPLLVLPCCSAVTAAVQHLTGLHAALWPDRRQSDLGQSHAQQPGRFWVVVAVLQVASCSKHTKQTLLAAGGSSVHHIGHNRTPHIGLHRES